jgi:hypothetical protein
MSSGGKFLLAGLAVASSIALIYAFSRSASAAGVTPKFKVGDHITYNVPSPTNAIYLVQAVNRDTGLYTLAQVFQGQPINPFQNYITVIDANYVLAA